MKSNNSSIRITVFVLTILFIGVFAVFWWKEQISPVDPANKAPITFTVKSGEGVRTIASNLASQSLIRSPTAFFILIKFQGIERNLQAGDFRLYQTMDAVTIASELTHGYLDAWITIPEGWRVEEIATRLARDLDIPESQFLSLAQEGYMFPDTYLVPRDATPAGIVEMFRQNFAQKVTAQMREDARKNGLSQDQLLILASIVEREGLTDEDRPVIAGILLNRWKAGWALGADATLQYALGYQTSEKSWWKKELTDADKKIQSKFNTYIYPGLPPKPIANPGLSAIKAVIYPPKTDYWYYLHDREGQAHYGRTLEEHNANIAKYL